MADAQPDDDVQFWAHYGNPPEDKPWALFKTEGPSCGRYVKHLDKYVEMEPNWDNVSGFSSDSMGRRPITPDEAKKLEPDIPDVDPAVVGYFGGEDPAFVPE